MHYLLALFPLSQLLKAEVVRPSEQMLSQDLSFGHEDPELKSDKREIASDEDKIDENSEREVASEGEDSSNGVKFWDYKN